MLKKIFLTFLLVTMITVAPVNAESENLSDPGMLPTNTFYFLKIWGENIGTFFTFGEDAKVERFLELSEKRLTEAKALTELGESEEAEKMMNRYELHLHKALEKAEKAKERGVDTDELLIKITNATLKHQDVLMDVYEKVPEEAKQSIERAMQESLKGHEEALKNVSSEQNREIVMENVREREQKLWELEEKGLPNLDLPIGNLPEIDIPEVDLPVDIELPQVPKRGR